MTRLFLHSATWLVRKGLMRIGPTWQRYAVAPRAQPPQLNRCANMPVFLTGDFNAASHLDYEGAVAWPCSTACAARGLIDGFAAARERGTAENLEAQRTWSAKPQEERHGVHDRIDFVYYTGSVELVGGKAVDGSNSGVQMG